MAIFRFFQDGGTRHLELLRFEIFNGQRVRRVELRHQAKLRDRSKGWRDMAIFWFLKIAAATILDF